ncbi:MAG: hypothetical protein JWO42_1828, partial [Chloroflexi bacterium]|nr:hypothetical protein [Chloroflexota bacterium]
MVIHFVVLVLGVAFILGALFSAIRTFVVPRGVPDKLTTLVFKTSRYLFSLRLPGSRPDTQERRLAYYAPVTLLSLPAVWLSSLLLGYTAIFWSLGASSWNSAF